MIDKKKKDKILKKISDLEQEIYVNSLIRNNSEYMKVFLWGKYQNFVQFFINEFPVKNDDNENLKIFELCQLGSFFLDLKNDYDDLKSILLKHFSLISGNICAQ